MPAKLHRLSGQDRFDRFTERARRVLALAQEEAQRFKHNYIGTEHLLLGLLREGDGVGVRVLRNMGVDLAELRASAENIIGRGDRILLGGEIGLTPRAKKVIELAGAEARHMEHHYIGTEHLLLGMIREGEGIAAGLLESVGVSWRDTRREVQSELERMSVSDVANKASTFTLIAVIVGVAAILGFIALRRKIS